MMRIEMLNEIAKQLNRLAGRLAADVPPGHVLYISKKRATECLYRIEEEIQEELDNE